MNGSWTSHGRDTTRQHLEQEDLTFRSLSPVLPIQSTFTEAPYPLPRYLPTSSVWSSIDRVEPFLCVVRRRLITRPVLISVPELD